MTTNIKTLNKLMKKMDYQQYPGGFFYTYAT